MKKKSDPRHKKRQTIIQSLFAHSFLKQETKGKQIKKISQNIDKIDALIEQAAPQWPIDKIAKIDLAILRLAVFELLIEKEQPSKVIIDEAVELAKEYAGDTSPAFINGVLGTLLKK